MSSDTHQRLFRRMFEPVVTLNDIVALRGQSGLLAEPGSNGSPYYVISHVETAPVIGTRGVIGVWCATTAPQAPFLMDPAATAGTHSNVTIAKGALSNALSPAWSVLQAHQFAQIRLAIHPLADSGAAALTGAIGDYDLVVSAPASTVRWGTPKQAGGLNIMTQASNPVDIVAMPAAGANVATQTNSVNDVFDYAERTELFVYGSDPGQLSLQVKNNGAGTAAAGGIGVQVGMFIFNMIPIPLDQHASPRFFMGKMVMTPSFVDLDRVQVIPISGQSTPLGIS